MCLLMTKISWFRQDTSKGFSTLIFDQVLQFDDLQPFTYLWKNFAFKFDTLERKICFLVRRFEGVIQVLELKFLVNFCILMIYNYYYLLLFSLIMTKISYLGSWC